MATQARETANLIGSDKVEGTTVYGADSQKIEFIERVMINKLSGKVSYAVLNFGGLFGLGRPTGVGETIRCPTHVMRKKTYSCHNRNKPWPLF